MRRFRSVVFLCFLSVPVLISAQNYINNPYTRYGIGDLINTGFAYNRSLGGSSLALRPHNHINYLNPASYTELDTMSFLFQGGLTGRLSNLSTDEGELQVGTANLEYLTIGFPLTRWWKVSVGLVPFSRIKYIYHEIPDIGNEDILISYTGDGGFNEFFFGTAWQPISSLSIGANFGYLFGKLEKNSQVAVGGSPATTIINQEFVARDFYFRLGGQYHPVLTDKENRTHAFILGLTYDAKVNVDVDYTEFAARDFYVNSATSLIDTFVYADSTEQMQLPQKIGIGLSYTLNDRLTVSAEMTQQNFGQGININRYDRLADYSSYRFGVEYVPVPLSDRTRANYFQRVHYRAGGHFTNTYLQFDGTQIQDYGFSVGLGLPWRSPDKLFTYTSFNITYEFGVRGTLENNLMKENYHILTIGFTLHDFWFRKPKYD